MQIANLKKAGRVGGLVRVRLYGNPGTDAGRKLGGLNSLRTHQKQQTGFKLLRKIKFPRPSERLAELLGILAGDGHINEYQVSMTTNSLTDGIHAQYTKRLLESLFDVPTSITQRKNQNACTVLLSSKEVSRFLVAKGMVKGNKITNRLHTPSWILRTKKFRLAFVRGLFDTDGCVYVDTHKINGRTYKNIGLAFTNRAPSLLTEFKDSLETLGLHPTQKTKYTVFLRRKNDIQEYFRLIGSSNPKHLKKVEQYFLRNGEVAELA